MSGGSKTQTTTTNNAPWSVAQPALQKGLSGALAAYNKDPTGAKSVYTGSTVVPWSANTQAGMGSIREAANANEGGAGLSGQYQDVINNGGFTAPQMDAMNNTRAIANSTFDINANPAFQEVLRQAQDSARDSVNLSAGGAGRYGSGTHQGVLGDTIGDLTSRMVGNEYTNWQNRRDAANTSLFNMGQGGLENLGAAYSGLKLPGTDLMQLGAMDEDLATREMNDKLRIFNEQNNAPWAQLGKLNAIASGAGQLGGTSTQTQPGQNPFLTALGYGTTGLGLLGGLF